MSTDKEMLNKSVAVLVETAANAAKIAKEQRQIADAQNDTAIEQHETARELEVLSDELAKGATAVTDNLAALAKSDAADAAVASTPEAVRRRA